MYAAVCPRDLFVGLGDWDATFQAVAPSANPCLVLRRNCYF